MKNKYGMEKLDRASKKVINFFKKVDAFERLKRHHVAEQYELVVTNPWGNKKNIDSLKIDVENVNETVINHPGNTSTSNLKNLLSTNQKKNNFSNKVTVPFDP
jgi:hypothetical protein